MRRLLPPSRSDHDPLSGRTWHHYRHGDLVTIDQQEYRFYRYDRKTNNVELSELRTRLLYWYDADLFIHGAENMSNPEVENDEMVMAYTVHTDDAVRKRRQAAREEYMTKVGQRDGKDTCRTLTEMANHWWPGTDLTRWEM